ncbi:hypothetical protein [Leptospira ilyithenensis]|uniref:Uncharacterized protein n=1 Tax=Leptospira ilyithenensis TaxID=2484901 RepID=A0A4V3JX45_9LEPT|nr:hypothetical protein [Leptospira ilyithenensis]TGN10877.1 hypothetical protein EHS11_06755 [Leptospira ilyithenensis]
MKKISDREGFACGSGEDVLEGTYWVALWFHPTQEISFADDPSDISRFNWREGGAARSVLNQEPVPHFFPKMMQITLNQAYSSGNR